MSDARAARYRADDRVESVREGAHGIELVLSAAGRRRLEADPDSEGAGLALDDPAVHVAFEQPEALKTGFRPPRWPRFFHYRSESGAVQQRITLVGGLQSDLHWLGGHFPGDPILPGVVQLDWAIELGRALLAVDGRFLGIDAMKFQHIMQPGRFFTLRIDYARERSRLRFEYCHADGHYSQGRVRFSGDSGA